MYQKAAFYHVFCFETPGGYYEKAINVFGVLLVGFGIFFLLNELHMSIAAKVYTWPVLLILIGAALLTESALSQDHSNLLASYILITLGIHFYVSEQIPFWPTNISMVVFMVAISFLLSARKAKSGFFKAAPF
ncbi:DUF5668 domain-containing protein [Priestia megaterium]